MFSPTALGNNSCSSRLEREECQPGVGNASALMVCALAGEPWLCTTFLTFAFAPAASCRSGAMGDVLAKVGNDPGPACSVDQVFSRSLSHWHVFCFFAFNFLGADCSGGAHTRVGHVYNC